MWIFKEESGMADKMYCTNCPYFKFTGNESDSWYGTKCEKDGHEEYPSMYAIKQLNEKCPLEESENVE